MKLKAKIKPKYLDEILSHNKKVEYRQFDEIELDDGKRVATFGVDEITRLPFSAAREVMRNHSDVNWVNELPIHEIKLGVNRGIFDKEETR